MHSAHFEIGLEENEFPSPVDVPLRPSAGRCWHAGPSDSLGPLGYSIWGKCGESRVSGVSCPSLSELIEFLEYTQSSF